MILNCKHGQNVIIKLKKFLLRNEIVFHQIQIQKREIKLEISDVVA
jgi:hypothetical protein